MSVTCGVNSEAETTVHPLFACHHCGMPVCEQHGWVVTADEAFDDGSSARAREADVARPLVSRAAMHCPKCADDYHKGMDRHHGWTDAWIQPARVDAPNAQQRVEAYGRT
jgi:hypothetical protein